MVSASCALQKAAPSGTWMSACAAWMRTFSDPELASSQQRARRKVSWAACACSGNVEKDALWYTWPIARHAFHWHFAGALATPCASASASRSIKGVSGEWPAPDTWGGGCSSPGGTSPGGACAAHATMECARVDAASASVAANSLEESTRSAKTPKHRKAEQRTLSERSVQRARVPSIASVQGHCRSAPEFGPPVPPSPAVPCKSPAAPIPDAKFATAVAAADLTSAAASPNSPSRSSNSARLPSEEGPSFMTSQRSTRFPQACTAAVRTAALTSAVPERTAANMCGRKAATAPAPGLIAACIIPGITL
mmetsp:Transcript_49923/g.142823  ORF Transcript_49923/g.142823 Transcript_49923/m.142823 type:complete len:309 (+) Transcript_49923:345-1271(+)